MRQLNRRKTLRGLGALAVLAPMAAQAQQPFAGKTVRLVIGFNPGTPADVMGRLIGPRLGEILGGQFIVDPRPGAGERVAAQYVATAPADGTTLLLMTGGQTIVAATDPTVRYDMLKDFRYVSMLVRYPFFVIVAGKSKYTTFKDLLAAARKEPGKLSYASAGVGTTTQLGMELLLQDAGAKMLHVPYAGGSKVAVDVQGGIVDAWYTVLSSTQGLIQAGDLRALAVTSKERDLRMPDVPPVADTIPSYDVTTWLALCAPAGTPDETVQRLNAAVKTVMAEPAIRERALSMGLTPFTNSPDEMHSRVVADIAKWKPLEALTR